MPETIPILQPLQKLMRDTRGLEPREGNLDEATKVWTEQERFRDEVVDALVIILKTRGCNWALQGGCTFCGYVNDSMVRKVTGPNMEAQMRSALASQYKGQRVVKIYTSGSFLDDTEVPREAQPAILALVPEQVAKVTVEAQSHHATREKLAAIRGALRPEVELEVAFGLESAHEPVLAYSVNKDDRFADFVAACQAARALGVRTKAYIMLKPPFLTEREALDDCVATALKAAPHCDLLSLNPCNVQSRTLVEKLWRRGQYRSPWLWTVAEALRRVSEGTATPVRSNPVGAGHARGAHNCGACDAAVAAAIEEFSLRRDPALLPGANCACREEWLDILELEGFLQGAQP
ncbi:MAG TPA: archaeosine biosynthesis radical SAM protein RaSEA [Candidatus Thermoplasmatota archaeon]|nr:archaeosine biosynthesis radical SAM protein RaSEA [Candidatus Thermoplasmatota archaeon]